MSLKDFLDLTDPALKEEFDRQKPDINALRKAAAKRVNKAIRQVLAPKPPRNPDLFEINNNVVKTRLPFMVSRGSIEDFEFTIPFERAADAFRKLLAAIESGETDEQLIEAEEGHTFEEADKPVKERKKRGSWSDEERARRAAAAAARKAAKSA